MSHRKCLVQCFPKLWYKMSFYAPDPVLVEINPLDLTSTITMGLGPSVDQWPSCLQTVRFLPHRNLAGNIKPLYPSVALVPTSLCSARQGTAPLCFCQSHDCYGEVVIIHSVDITTSWGFQSGFTNLRIFKQHLGLLFVIIVLLGHYEIRKSILESNMIVTAVSFDIHVLYKMYILYFGKPSHK